MDKRERNNNEIEIDVVPILKALFSKLWLMLLVGVILAGSSYVLTKTFIKPTYRCGFTAYVNNQHAQGSKDTLSNSDLSASKQLSDTYVRILKSNQILTAAAESIGSDVSYSRLVRMVTADVQGDTEIIAVYVENQDPQFAYDLANAIATVSPSHMSDIVEGSSMKIIDYPVYNTTRYKPSYIKYSFLGLLVGMLIVGVVVIIRYINDDTVKTEDEIEQRFRLPILGVLPDITESGKGDNDYYSYEYGYGYGNKPDKTDKEQSRHEK